MVTDAAAVGTAAEVATPGPGGGFPPAVAELLTWTMRLMLRPRALLFPLRQFHGSSEKLALKNSTIYFG